MLWRKVIKAKAAERAPWSYYRKRTNWNPIDCNQHGSMCTNCQTILTLNIWQVEKRWSNGKVKLCPGCQIQQTGLLQIQHSTFTVKTYVPVFCYAVKDVPNKCFSVFWCLFCLNINLNLCTECVGLTKICNLVTGGMYLSNPNKNSGMFLTVSSMFEIFSMFSKRTKQIFWCWLGTITVSEFLILSLLQLMFKCLKGGNCFFSMIFCETLNLSRLSISILHPRIGLYHTAVLSDSHSTGIQMAVADIRAKCSLGVSLFIELNVDLSKAFWTGPSKHFFAKIAYFEIKCRKKAKQNWEPHVDLAPTSRMSP